MPNFKLVKDSLAELKKLPDGSYDFIFTDPPYHYPNTNSRDMQSFRDTMSNAHNCAKKEYKVEGGEVFLKEPLDIKAYFNEFMRVSKKKLVMVFSGKWDLGAWITAIRENKFNFYLLIINKTNPAFVRYVQQNNEFLLIIFKKCYWDFKYIMRQSSDITQTNIRTLPHIASKDIPYCETIIHRFVRPDWRGLDPFVGGGSLIKAGELNNVDIDGWDVSQTCIDWATALLKRPSNYRLF